MAARGATDDLTPEARAARLAPHIERAAAERASAKGDRRAQFPFMAEMTDLFRDAGMNPRPVYARNDKGEEWGRNPDPLETGTGPKAPPLPDYDAHVASFQRFYGKKAETNATYRERMQRAIKPITGSP